jgi:SulP family sulfate permease
MKMLDWLVGYRKDWLRPDIIAGLIAAAVVIPKAMAYATVAGLPVQAGLYTALVPLVIYAVLGSSRVLSVSTTTTIAILTGANLALVVPDGDPSLLLRASATLALMVGVLLALASVLRFGFLATFISEPVLSGFKAGIGVVIVLDQVPKLLGVHFPKGTFLQNQLALLQSLPETSAATLAVGLVMIAVLLGLKRFVPRVPAPLGRIGCSSTWTMRWPRTWPPKSRHSAPDIALLRVPTRRHSGGNMRHFSVARGSWRRRYAPCSATAQT